MPSLLRYLRQIKQFALIANPTDRCSLLVCFSVGSRVTKPFLAILSSVSCSLWHIGLQMNHASTDSQLHSRFPMLLQSSKYRPALLSSRVFSLWILEFDLVIRHCRMKVGSMISMELINNLHMSDY
jgi:hypothetical protein